MNIAATNNAECKKRMLYMIAELKNCQDAKAKNNPSWGIGYVGGVPKSEAVWTSVKTGISKLIMQHGLRGTMYIKCMQV